MAAKLKNLKIRKVDFVDEGANPDANIGIVLLPIFFDL